MIQRSSSLQNVPINQYNFIPFGFNSWDGNRFFVVSAVLFPMSIYVSKVIPLQITHDSLMDFGPTFTSLELANGGDSYVSIW